MPRPIPFLFCRYQMVIEEEVLDGLGQLHALESVKGQLLPHGMKAAREGIFDTLIMRPRLMDVDNEKVLKWSIGHKPGMRVRTDYDPITDELAHSQDRDSHTVFTNFIAVPRLGAVAIDDRASDLYIGGRPALSRMRSAFQNVEGGHFQAQMLAHGDVNTIVQTLALTEYQYSVRRFNPHTPSALARRLSEAMAEEGIFVNRGTVKPAPGEVMRAREGLIQSTSDLATDGYGVVGFRGRTDAGHEAHIPKPPFSTDKQKNLERQAADQRLRVFFDRTTADEDVTPSVVAELVRFYGTDGPPKIPEEPSGGMAA